MAGGLGAMLDGLACRISGHIWVQRTDIEDVMLCSRCHATYRSAPLRRGYRRRRKAPGESVIPENRPWLEPPFTASQFE